MSTVAFIGAGEFGGRLARRLIAHGGHETVICDASPEVARTFAGLGATIAADPVDCATADLVIVFVATAEQVRACLLGDRGLLHGFGDRPPLVAIGSTVAPEIVLEAGAELGRRGVQVIDIPATGAIAFAERGEIQILAGGDISAVDAARPVLEVFSRKILHAGPLGSGQRLKILNNLLSISAMYLTAEALGIAAEHAMPLELAIEAINDGSGQNFWTLLRPDGIAEQYSGYTSSAEYWETFRSITRKDLALAVALSAEKSLHTPVLDAVSAVVARLGPTDELENMRRIAEVGTGGSEREG